MNAKLELILKLAEGQHQRDMSELGIVDYPEAEDEFSAAVAFVARAVVTREAMLSALKLCVAEMKAMHSHHHPTCDGGCPYEEAHQRARFAIARAEGRAEV